MNDTPLQPETDVALAPGEATAVAEQIGAAGEAGMAAGWAADAPLIARRGTWQEVWSRFRRDKFAVVGMAVIIGLVIVALFAPWIAPYDPTKQFDAGLTMQGMPVGPSAKFLLGTDTLGRDMLSRIIYGARVSLVIGCWPTASPWCWASSSGSPPATSAAGQRRRSCAPRTS